MPHHSEQELNSEIAKIWLERASQIQANANQLGLGPTGQYPQGKLTETDQGEIQIAIAVVGGKVVINFGSPVAWIGFDPDQAKEIGRLLTEKAIQARAAGLQP